MSILSKTLKTGIIGTIAAVFMSSSAFAGGELAAAPAEKACGLSANVAVTSDYVFRGISQTDEKATLQAGVDAECGIFYAGIWGSGVDFDGTGDDFEVDFYAGIKPTYAGITFDLGVIVYTYEESDSIVELKAGASAEVYAGATLGFTAYADFENEVYTYEGTFEKAFSKVGPFVPTLSAAVGLVDFDGGDYAYWNAGVSLGFGGKYALDLRYHDTDVDTDLTDERFVATLSASF